jgi:hypothetical protein
MPRQLLHRRPGLARCQAGGTVAGFGAAVGVGAVQAGLVARVDGAAGDACLSVGIAGVRP